MPTFVFEESVATNGGTFLLPIPAIQWFADSVMSALQEMTDPNNWRGDSEVYRAYALSEAAKMLSYYKLLNFNPFPPGMIFPFGGTVAPAGYLVCDGSSYVATDYPELFAQIGYYYGGSGSNFSVPDLLNRVAVGSGDLFNIGDVGGQQSVTLSTGEIPSHAHVADAPTVIDPSHSHVEGNAIPTAIAIGPGIPAPSAIPSVGVTGNAVTGISVLAPNINPTGGDGAHENMQPYLASLYIIYAGR